MAVAVKPVGNVSVTVTVPLVEAVPELVTVIVYCAPVWPCVKFPLCDLVIVRSGCTTAVGSVSVLFDVLVSPPPETETELVTLAGAFDETFTVRVIVG